MNISPRCLALLLPCCLVLGCGKSSKKTYAVQDGKVIVSGSQKTIEVLTGDGEKGTRTTLDVGGSVPADFPKDIAVYPGAKVTISVKNPGMQSLTLESSDSNAKVAQFYKDKMKSDGWSIESEVALDNMVSVTGKKADRTLMAISSFSDGKATISLTETKPAPEPK